MVNSDQIKSILTHPLFIGPLGGSFVILLTYLDSKYRDTDRERATYIKLFVVSSLVFATLTYFVTSKYETDEFLEQSYDTSQPSLLPKNRSGGGGREGVDSALLGDPFFEQQPLEGPGNHIESMMNDLPEPGTFHKPRSKSHRYHGSRSGKSRKR